MSERVDEAVSYGGQSVMEGVMMRGRCAMAVAVRAPSGAIVVWSEPIRSSRLARRVRPWPVVRGAILLGDTLALGMRALVFSAAVSRQGAAGSSEEPVDATSSMTGEALWLTVGVALLCAIGLFFVLPLFAAALFDRFIASAVVSNLVEGGIRLGLLLGYVVAIGRVAEIRRVFGYHGAEHKAIHAWEAGDELAVERVRRYPLEHPRCGTGFLLVVMVLSVVIFTLLGRPSLPLRLASRIILLPVIAGVAFEFLKFGGRHAGGRITRLLLAPGMKLQRLTTRKPDDGMLEVAIVALLSVLMADGKIGADDPRLAGALPVDANGKPSAQPVRIDEERALAAD